MTQEEKIDVRLELVEIVRELYAAGLVTGTGGNVSVRVPGSDNEIWITPAGRFKGRLQPEMLVRVGLDGGIRATAALRPSSEHPVHRAIYRSHPQARAVIHAHAPQATILVDAGLPFPPVSVESAALGEIARLPFLLPGSDELADAVTEAMRQSRVVLLQNHGLVVAAENLRRAADVVEIVERTAQVILGCHAVGREPPALPEGVVAEIRRRGEPRA